MALRETALAAVEGVSTASVVGPAVTENREAIDAIARQLHAVAIPLTVALLLAIGYAAISAGTGERPAPQTRSGERIVEVVWVVGTVLVLAFAGLAGYPALDDPYVSPDQPRDVPPTDAEWPAALPETDDEEVLVRASQWEWNATYRGSNATTRNELVIPANDDVTIWLASDDVVHSLSVPALGVTQDAFPDRHTRIRTHAAETGVYEGFCVAYCGPGHSTMRLEVTVVDPETYEAWLERHDGADGPVEPPEIGGSGEPPEAGESGEPPEISESSETEKAFSGHGT